MTQTASSRGSSLILERLWGDLLLYFKSFLLFLFLFLFVAMGCLSLCHSEWKDPLLAYKYIVGTATFNQKSELTRISIANQSEETRRENAGVPNRLDEKELWMEKHTNSQTGLQTTSKLNNGHDKAENESTFSLRRQDGGEPPNSTTERPDEATLRNTNASRADRCPEKPPHLGRCHI